MAQKPQNRYSAKIPVKKGNTNSQVVAKDSSNNNFYKPAYYFLFFFSFLLYSDSLLNQYALDDRMLITENQYTKEGISGIGKILSTDSFVGFFGKQKNLVAGGRYRPLPQVMYAIEYSLFGLSPFMEHLITILLYVFACLLVFKVLTMFFPPGNKPWYFTIPFIATALFIAHPLHTEVVANIKGRDEILSLLGSFGALYFVYKYIKNSRLLDLIWASLVFFLGLMSKENAITFLSVIPLTLYFFTKSTLRKVLISLGCLLFVTVIFIFIRFKVLGFLMSGGNIDYELLNNPFLKVDTLQKYATILLTWGKYLLLLIFPHPLTHDYYPKQIPIIGMNDFRAIIPLLIYVFMFIYALINAKKKTIISYSIFFFILTFSISSNLVFPIGTFMNDRFMFIPLLGFCIIIAYLFSEKFQKWFGESSYRNVIFTLLGAILLLYSVKTISRNLIWHDDYTLFTTDVKVSTNSAKCNVSAGGQTLEKLKDETDTNKKKKMIYDAINYLNKGIKIYPKYTIGWILLGNAMLALEDYKKASEYYISVLSATPYQKDAINNLLYCAQKTFINKDYDESIFLYRKLIFFQPKNNDLYIPLALVYERKNQIDSVLKITNSLLIKDPSNVAALSNMGEVYGKYLKNYDKSLDYLLKAYSISPNDASLLENLGVVYGMKNNFQKSVEYFNKAITIKPDNPQIYMNMAGSYLNMGNTQKANECKVRAVELLKVKK